MDKSCKILLSHPNMISHSSTNVLFVASEADPLIKVGGLGDVAGSLPRALRAAGSISNQDITQLDVRLVIPFHPAIRDDIYHPQKIAEFSVHSLKKDILAQVFSLELDDLQVYLIWGESIHQATGVYTADLEADGYKYVFFSQAALNLAKYLDWRPDILHANDWHTAAAVYSLALTRPISPFFRSTASLLTIHNLPYLGAMSDSALEAFELPAAENTSLPVWASHMALPLGMLTADAIVAVSPGYAREIKTQEFGSGLHNFLKAQSDKLSGILNGLDIVKWNPATDSCLAATYSADNLPDRIANKIFLQNELNLANDPKIPLLAMVTRMDPQKGVDIGIDAIRYILQTGNKTSPHLQAVLLGTGDPVIEQSVCRLEQDYPDHVRALITYDDRMSRHIYAGADMLLMPSRYEPCGLAQLIAMHYGCIPVARATGGLSDTVLDSSASNKGTGFLFKQATPEALVEAIKRALALYQHSTQEWQKMQLRGMQQDFSWDRSAKEYIHLYKKLIENRPGI